MITLCSLRFCIYVIFKREAGLGIGFFILDFKFYKNKQFGYFNSFLEIESIFYFEVRKIKFLVRKVLYNLLKNIFFCSF